jgi:hypothetical protein
MEIAVAPSQQIHDDAKNLEKIRAKCKASIFWTAWYICGFRKLSIVLHYAMCEWFQRGLESGDRWFLCLVPRGHFKTSLLTIAHTIWVLINDPNKRVLIVMHNTDIGKAKGRKIKSILQGQAMRIYFPELVPDAEDRRTTWTALEFSVKRTAEHAEASVTIAGVKSGVTGGHYDVIIPDDLVDFKASNSAEVMKWAVDFSETMDPLFEDEDSILCGVGTLWPGGETGYYEQQMKNTDYRIMVLGAYCDDRFYTFLDELGIKVPKDDADYIDNRLLEANRELAWQEGQPIFPERRSMEGLAKTLKTMKAYKFAHQMLNVLLDEGSRKFRKEDFLPYTRQHSNDGKPLAIYIDGVAIPFSRGFVTACMDPTGGLNKLSDDAGISVFWWYGPMQCGCLLEYWQAKSPDPMEQIKTFLDLGEKWGAKVLRPEGGSMQVWVGYWLKQKMMERHLSFEIDPFTPNYANKGKRLLDGFHPFVADHQVYVLYPQHEPLVDHLVSLNIAPDGTILGDSPALADTMAMHIKYWTWEELDEKDDPTHIRNEDPYASYPWRTKNQPVRYGLIRRGGR